VVFLFMFANSGAINAITRIREWEEEQDILREAARHSAGETRW
jgi:hypothetical protein